MGVPRRVRSGVFRSLNGGGDGGLSSPSGLQPLGDPSDRPHSSSSSHVQTVIRRARSSSSLNQLDDDTRSVGSAGLGIARSRGGRSPLARGIAGGCSCGGGVGPAVPRSPEFRSLGPGRFGTLDDATPGSGGPMRTGALARVRQGARASSFSGEHEGGVASVAAARRRIASGTSAELGSPKSVGTSMGNSASVGARGRVHSWEPGMEHLPGGMLMLVPQRAPSPLALLLERGEERGEEGGDGGHLRENSDASFGQSIVGTGNSLGSAGGAHSFGSPDSTIGGRRLRKPPTVASGV